MGKVKQWKSGGIEDKYIKKLIKQGKVSRYTKPPYLQSENPAMFAGFSINVIRNHLTELKRKCGLYVGESGTDDENDDANMSIRQEERIIDECIASASACGINQNVDINSMTGFDKVSHQNYPIVCKTYIDPESDSQKVLLVISIPGGSEGVKLEVVDEGRSVIVRYSWSKSMYNVNDLFKVQLEGGEFSPQHALISCFKAGLTESRKRIDFAPVGMMKVALPIQVQKHQNTWKRWGIFRKDGTQVLICKFSAIATEYLVEHTDEAVVFGK